MAEQPKKIDHAITWTPFYCKHCSTCVNICPVKNLEFKDDEMVSLGKCTQCELCQKYCPDFAIEVEPRKKKEPTKAEDGE
jgi:ferredoxin